MTIEAMKQALEALRKAMQGNLMFDEAMEAFKKLDQAIEQAEKQEPVAWMRHDGKRVTTAEDRKDYPDYETRYSIPLYTSPPPRQPLTDEQIEELCWIEMDRRLLSFARAIEAAHGIK